MKLPKRNSFVVGFVAALLVVGLFVVWRNAAIVGGRAVDSPNRAYQLNITARMDPQPGGTYTIKLVQNATGNILRTITIQLPKTESTVSVRENGATIDWAADSSYADILISGQKSIRVWIPNPDHREND